MKKVILPILVVICFHAHSQQGKLFKEADYFFENKAYYEALEAYKTGLKSNPKYIDGRYKLAMSHFYVRNYQQAREEFLKLTSLLESDKEATQQYAPAWYYQGLVLKTSQEYEGAKASFVKFIKIKTYEESMRELKRMANNEVRSCNFAIEQVENQYYESFIVERLEGKANSGYSEFSPRFYSDNTLIFSSLYGNTLQKKTPGESETPLVKTFVSHIKNETAIDVEEFEDFNDDFFHTANGSFTADKKTFYFTLCGENRDGESACEIYRSDRIGKRWTPPQKLKSGINVSGYTSTQPYYGAVKYGNRSFDALYFVSDRPGGRGGLDIWFAEVEKGGTFKTPVNCGSTINSPGNEVSPFYSSEERTIYFSSDYWWGLGGYDVFKSEGYRKSWKRPENLGIPVNSSYDDTYFSFDEKMRKGLLSSNRPGGELLSEQTCCEDIYVVTGNPAEELLAIVKDEDSTELVLPETRVGYSIIKEGQPEGINWIAQSDEAGKFSFVRELRNSYRLILDKSGYKVSSFALDSVMQHKPDSGIYTFYLKKISEDKIHLEPVASTEEILAKANREIFTEDKIEKQETQKGDVFILDNLHFDFNKSQLKDDFFKELDVLARFLTTHPEIKIEISGHTDAQGSDDYNLHLSQRRAEIVKQYLTEKGIDEERLTATGYGEQMPIADNETEEGRKLNRRTEVRIL